MESYRHNKQECIWRGRDGSSITGEKTLIMGVINVTPDSFSDGGKFFALEKAVERGRGMEGEGADILDVGGESTRPGSEPVSEAEELERVIPVIRDLKKRVDIPISVDTTKSEVARQALQEGAEIVNDISGLTFDPKMGEVIASNKAPVVLMHMRGTPKTMQKNTLYKDVIEEICNWLKERIEYAESCGIGREKIAIDPGIGFGKSVEDNLKIISNLEAFKTLGRPIVLGTSRKSFIGRVLGLDCDDRFEGTLSTGVAGVMKGATVLRVHDVKEMRRAVDMADAIMAV